MSRRVARRMAFTPNDQDGVSPDFISLFRLWLDGAYGQAQVWNLFASRLGPSKGRRAARALETMVSDIAACALRPLRRSPSGCSQVSADEARLERMTVLAASGAADRARAAASGVFPPEATDAILENAAVLGAMIRLINGGESVDQRLPLRINGHEPRTLH